MGKLNFTPQEFIESSGLPDLLATYKRLRIQTAKEGYLQVAGKLDFSAEKPGSIRITDSFELLIKIPFIFPASPPLVFELGNRIPKSFHRLEGGALCLGSPTRQRLSLARNPNVASFFREFVIPYLYSFALHEQDAALPFGELAHGRRGLIDDFKSLYFATSDEVAVRLVHLTSRPKRKANRQLCPCGSTLRLSQCKLHHRVVLELRKRLGRVWFRSQHEILGGGTKKQIPTR